MSGIENSNISTSGNEANVFGAESEAKIVKLESEADIASHEHEVNVGTPASDVHIKVESVSSRASPEDEANVVTTQGREVFRVENSRLTSCYLVIQPTKWCFTYKHEYEFRVCWRQCNHHYHSGRLFALCDPDRRDCQPMILPHDRFSHPNHVLHDSQCPTCQQMFRDVRFQTLQVALSEVRAKLQAPGLTADDRNKYNLAGYHYMEELFEVELIFRDRSRRKMWQAAMEVFATNPVMQIYKGTAWDAEISQRPQCPSGTLHDQITIIGHPGKRMLDPGA